MSESSYIKRNFDDLGRADDAKLKITSSEGATKWLIVTPAEVRAVRALLEQRGERS
jgi:hypothetical protein